MKNLKKFLPAGTLGLSLLLHLVIFFGISGIIIIQAVKPKIVPMGENLPAASTDIPAPPDLPEDTVENPSPVTPDEPSTDIPQPTSAPDLNQIVSSAPAIATPSFNIAAAPALPPSHATTPPPANTEKPANSERQPAAMRVMSNPFGSAVQQGDSALVGTMYDLKQTSDRKPTEFTGYFPVTDAVRQKEIDVCHAYHAYLLNFVEHNWDQKLLDRFYKVEKPMGAYQIFIPGMGSPEAPKAFKVDQFVKPNRWIIIYRGNFTAPASGTFRFVGICDDLMAVRLKGQNVLDGSLYPLTTKVPRENIGPSLSPGRGSALIGGSWFTLNAGENYPIEILIGEEPGGAFYAFLLIQKKGEDYPYRLNKKEYGPILPVFQLAPTNMPKYEVEKNGPPVAKTPFICQ